MVEQTDLVRLRMVRMSNVPDTLYMVNNAVPQCCHMISHQQMACNLPSAPSVVANEIPGEMLRDEQLSKEALPECRSALKQHCSTVVYLILIVHLSVPPLSLVKEMIRRLQEIRHTEQVQRAYLLNCGEGATVGYELQLRVLREFGLADAATELLQVSRKGIMYY